ncbi:hypothetical protein MTR67_027678, partial [Solanum verrucosum]
MAKIDYFKNHTVIVTSSSFVMIMRFGYLIKFDRQGKFSLKSFGGPELIVKVTVQLRNAELRTSKLLLYFLLSSWKPSNISPLLVSAKVLPGYFKVELSIFISFFTILRLEELGFERRLQARISSLILGFLLLSQYLIAGVVHRLPQVERQADTQKT